MQGSSRRRIPTGLWEQQTALHRGLRAARPDLSVKDWGIRGAMESDWKSEERNQEATGFSGYEVSYFWIVINFFEIYVKKMLTLSVGWGAVSVYLQGILFVRRLFRRSFKEGGREDS